LLPVAVIVHPLLEEQSPDMVIVLPRTLLTAPVDEAPVDEGIQGAHSGVDA